MVGRKAGPHVLNKLTALTVARQSKPGKYADGGGLYLNVATGGSKSWIFRFMLDGHRREMGLGPLTDVPLAQARELAKEKRLLLHTGMDPLLAREEAKKQELVQLMAIENSTKSWDWCCRTYVATVKEPELTNPKHIAQWLSTLEAYTFPQWGSRPVSSITLQDVYAVLSEIWLTKNETASRVRQRIEKVLSWAKVMGYRDGDNPAVWNGGLDHLLAKPSKVQEERHHPSLPYVRASEFWRALLLKEGIAPMALRFLVLTVNRVSPIVTMEWSEVDFEKAVWVSPADKMKGRYPHRVPLTKPAIEVLEQMKARAQGSFVFQSKGEPITASAVNMVINKGLTKYSPPFIDPQEDDRGITPHGFRSTFKVWITECTEYPHQLSELALAHAEESKTVAAYLRTDALEKRRPMMQAWADFVTGK